MAYTRQAGLSSLQHEQLVLNFARQHGRVRRADVVELCRLKEGHAKALLVQMRDAGQLVAHGNRGGTFYVLPTAHQDPS
ncbi:MAG: hypothetical protein J0I65_18960 [Variovorax sp.]|nr:hypothetical protein [Variovorax sp.]